MLLATPILASTLTQLKYCTFGKNSICETRSKDFCDQHSMPDINGPSYSCTNLRIAHSYPEFGPCLVHPEAYPPTYYLQKMRVPL
jgi:hypothetical protein